MSLSRPPSSAFDGTAMSRRGALQASAAALAAAGFAGLAHAAQPQPAPRAVRAMAPEELTFDATKGEFILPELPYPENALEPYIDAETMNIHRTQHHAAYVRNLNAALKRLAEIRDGSGDEALTKHWEREVAFNASGHANHTLFWSIMAPPGDGAGQGGGVAPQPTTPLGKAIDASFGSFDKFSKQFKGVAAAVEGAGWAWLAFDPASRRLYVTQSESQQHMSWRGVTALMGIDVWEHAYYLKYRSKRKDYIEAFMHVINWARVNANYARAAG